MYSIFHIEGGIGKNILATAVVSTLKQSDLDRKIIIVTAWPQVWFNNPDVFQVYPFGHLANFYKNFVIGQDVKIFRQEPYHSEGYILKKEHLIISWCRICGLEYDGSNPRLYFSPLELEYIRLKILKDVNKPILLLHTNGGSNGRPYSWHRDIPHQNVLDVVEHFKSSHHIYQIGYEDQNLVEGCVRLNLDTREILASPLFSSKRLLIDSFTQHAAAALGAPSSVCWIGNKPKVLGYNIHNNLLPESEPKFDTYHSSYLEDFDISGHPVQFPFDTIKLFDSQKIIESL